MKNNVKILQPISKDTHIIISEETPWKTSGEPPIGIPEWISEKTPQGISWNIIDVTLGELPKIAPWKILEKTWSKNHRRNI